MTGHDDRYGDPEIGAIQEIWAVLAPLDPAVQMRIADWLNHRIVAEAKARLGAAKKELDAIRRDLISETQA